MKTVMTLSLMAQIVLLINCAPKPELDRNCNLVGSWHRSDVIFQINDNFSQQQIEALNSAASTWNAAIGHNIISVTASSRSPASSRDSVNSIVLENFAVTRPSDSSDKWAITSNITVSDYLTDSDIKFNFAHPDFVDVDFESLALHEFGHAIGLDHSPNTADVMYPELSERQIKRTLSPIDIERAHCAYK